MLRRILVPALAFGLLGAAATTWAQPAPEAPAPDAAPAPRAAGPEILLEKRLACEKIVLTSFENEVASPAAVVTVENEVGNTGIRFLMKGDEVMAVEAWDELAGRRTTTVLPGLPRIDYVGCTDASPLGGIVVQYVDARSILP